MTAFEPLFRNPHLQTIAGHWWPRRGEESRYPVKRNLFQTEADVQVLVESQQPAGPTGHVILIHGLEGSGQAPYMRSLSGAALRRGFAAHRFHMRTCGGTEHLCATLYHAGLTSDLSAVLRQMHAGGSGPLFLVGFSLGGNVALKLAGELSDTAHELIAGVCAVSAPLDLAMSSRRISEVENRVYERRFVRHMRARLCATGRYRPADFAGLRSVFDIDNRITAPSFGFGDAANYYRTQSAIRYVEQIRVPALLVHARDDTLAPFTVYESEAVRGNPMIQLIATEHGGHLGFIGRRPHRFWLDEMVMEWISHIAPVCHTEDRPR